MSVKGYALIDYTWCRYVFEECEPRTYIYRLEMLNSFPGSTHSKDYIKFLEETGIEHVASYMKWIFLRKKTELGSFNLFTDIDSKIKHHIRVSTFLFPLSALNFGIGFINLFNSHSFKNPLLSGMSILNLVLGGIIAYHALRHFKKVIKLRQDKSIYEC